MSRIIHHRAELMLIGPHGFHRREAVLRISRAYRSLSLNQGLRSTMDRFDGYFCGGSAVALVPAGERSSS
jgi:hypothetical protein